MPNTRPYGPRQSLYLPDDLVQKLTRRAERNDRSFNREVKRILQAAVDAEEKEQAAQSKSG